MNAYKHKGQGFRLFTSSCFASQNESPKNANNKRDEKLILAFQQPNPVFSNVTLDIYQIELCIL